MAKSLVAYHSTRPFEFFRPSRAYCLLEEPTSAPPYLKRSIIGPLYSHVSEEGRVAEYFPLEDLDFNEFVQDRELDTPWTTDVGEVVVPVGAFYPRMWRGSGRASYPNPPLWESRYEQSFTRSTERIEGLLEEARRVFRVVYPCDDNKLVYGTAIRSILIAACNEVETQWRGVLEANGVKREDGRYTTRDYVLLLEAMRLDSYALSLRRYPGYSPIHPFSTWAPRQPTQSLFWYDAYNKTKHDADTCLPEARLQNALDAIAAAVILLIAQFGPKDLLLTQVSEVFLIERIAEWHPTEMYYGPLPRVPWREVHYPFSREGPLRA